MRKLGRILRRVLTAVSLLLFVAVLAAWTGGSLGAEEKFIQRICFDGSQWKRIRTIIGYRDGQIRINVFTANAKGDNARQAGASPGTWWDFMDNRTPLEPLVDSIYRRSERHWERGGVVVEQARWLGDTKGPFEQYMLTANRETSVAFHCWMAAIVFGALPSWRCFVWWRGVRRRRLASREGRCPVCGYDLRASPQRCPECGTARGAV